MVHVESEYQAIEVTHADRAEVPMATPGSKLVLLPIVLLPIGATFPIKCILCVIVEIIILNFENVAKIIFVNLFQI